MKLKNSSKTVHEKDSPRIDSTNSKIYISPTISGFTKYLLKTTDYKKEIKFKNRINK